MVKIPFIHALKDRLTRMSANEPLSWFSLFLILLFDVFLFSIIADWLWNVTREIPTPESYAGYSCTSLLETQNEVTETERNHSFLQRLYDAYSYNENYSYYRKDSYLYGNGCATIETLVKKIIHENTAFQNLRTKLTEVENLLSKNAAEQTTIRWNYDTKLLEKIAWQDPNSAINGGTAESAKWDLKVLTEKQKTLEKNKESLENEILTLQDIGNLLQEMKNQKWLIMDTYNRLVFWYPVKVFGVEVLFLLPIFILSLFWVRRAIAHNKEVQILVASHVLAVLSIFALMKILEFIYDILPHRLIENLINFLESWNILALWYYILILFGIFWCLWLIYVVQKKILSRDRMILKYLASNRCVACGGKMLEGAEHCMYCGHAKYEPCKACKKKDPIGTKFCTSCGKAKK